MESLDRSRILRRCVRAHGLSTPGASVEDAVRRAAGVYGSTPTCYLSTAARTEGFEAGMLQDALISRKTLVRIPAMRGSVYLLPRDLVPAGLALGKASGGARWLRPALLKGDLTERRIGALVTSVEELLAAGPKTASEIRKGLGDWKDPFPQALTLLLRHLTYEGKIVGARSRGSWRSPALEYALLRDWIGLPKALPSVEKALSILAPLYFDANGPATIVDFAWWAGIRPQEARRVVDTLHLESVTVEGLDGVHFATSKSLDDLGPRDGQGATTLVPYWDAYLMAGNDRRRYLDPNWTDRVVDRSGNVTNAVLKDGRVVGIWDCVDDALRFASFESLSVNEVRDGGEPLQRLLRFRGVERVPMPGPLADRGQNAFMSPLRRST